MHGAVLAKDTTTVAGELHGTQSAENRQAGSGVSSLKRETLKKPPWSKRIFNKPRNPKGLISKHKRPSDQPSAIVPASPVCLWLPGDDAFLW